MLNCPKITYFVIPPSINTTFDIPSHLSHFQVVTSVILPHRDTLSQLHAISERFYWNDFLKKYISFVC